MSHEEMRLCISITKYIKHNGDGINSGIRTKINLCFETGLAKKCVPQLIAPISVRMGKRIFSD